MAKAKKLPSGSWRAQVYSYTDADNKRHYESFTAGTKAEAELMASEFAAHKHRKARHDLTVQEAIEGYIRAKENILSPSTIREYRRMLKYDFGGLLNKHIKKITREDLQLYVNDLAAKNSPKTVRNKYGLLRASLSLYDPDINFRVTFPAKQIKHRTAPSDEVVAAIYEAAPPMTKKCIALALCSLRRGEIAALQYEDIVDGVAHIHADVVQDQTGKWIYKEIPKTDGSDRFVTLPDSVLELLGEGEGFVIPLTPNKISYRFDYVANKLGYDIHLHDLRHFFASTAAILKIPDIYTADMGGWRHDSKVMKEVYQNNITTMSDLYARKMNRHLDGIIKKKDA